jgi:hypothetical protein
MEHEVGGGRGGSPRRRSLIRVLVALGLLVAAALTGFVVWASIARSADPAALQAVLDDPDVEVVLGEVVEVRPAGRDPVRGVVFYPGARVDPAAYVATWADVAVATDTLVLIPRMRLNLAVLSRGRAAELIGSDPDVDEWWVGGHSLGGAMAASWAGQQPAGTVDGLVLWAAYATSGAGLDARDDLEVLSVSGSRDGLTTPEDVAQGREMLPTGAHVIEVEGMNHAQFGRYGPQRGDLEPTIDDADATEALVDAHLEVFAPASSPPAG